MERRARRTLFAPNNASSISTLVDKWNTTPDARYVKDSHWIKRDTSTVHRTEVSVLKSGSPRERIKVQNDDHWIRRDSRPVPQSMQPTSVQPTAQVTRERTNPEILNQISREDNSNLRRRQPHQASPNFLPKNPDQPRQVSRKFVSERSSAQQRAQCDSKPRHRLSASHKLLTRTFIIGVLLLTLVFVAWYLNRANALQGPYFDLHAFSKAELAKKRDGSVMDLPTESLSQYAQAACTQARNAYATRSGLEKQLHGVPKPALHELLDRAVLPDVVTRSSIQNTTLAAGVDDKAFHYMAFWSTAAHTHGYSACVATAGVQIIIGEDIEEWRTTETQRHVGDKPCHCGYLRCEKCPVFETDETRTPIYKRHRLTIRQQTQLFNWMSSTVAERAGELALNNRNSIISFFFPPKPNAYIHTSNFKPLDPDMVMGHDNYQSAIRESNLEQTIEW